MFETGIINSAANCIAVELLTVQDFAEFMQGATKTQQAWVKSCEFAAKAGKSMLLPGDDGQLELVICLLRDYEDYAFAGFFASLPARSYKLSSASAEKISEKGVNAFVLEFSRSFYKFNGTEDARAKLVVDNMPQWLAAQLKAEARLRDLINTPTEDLSTNEFASEIIGLADEYGAEVEVFIDDLETSFPAVWAVGRASPNVPQVVNLRWGNKKHPKLALVGKGVCYDTGGLNLKPGNSMLQMKKDMSGAAHALALAEMLMATDSPVQLDVWIPLAENSLGGASYRPGDVINSRSGRRIEITNTDAEGRLLLADAITAACAKQPDMLIDFASLTGAARVALGPDLVPFFAANTKVNLQDYALLDDFWELPLYKKYKSYLNSEISDTMNASLKGMAGAITAALFLQEFVNQDLAWLHFDIYAHDGTAGAKASVGAKAQGLTGCYHYVLNDLCGNK